MPRQGGLLVRNLSGTCPELDLYDLRYEVAVAQTNLYERWGGNLKVPSMPAHLAMCHIRTRILLSIVLGMSVAAHAGLPSGLSRYNPAGLATNWVYEADAFNVLREPDSSGTTIPVIRLQHPQRGYFLTLSPKEVEIAEKSGFVEQGIAFYVVGTSSIPVHRFRIPTTGGYFYATNGATVPDKGWVDEGVAFYASPPQADDAAATSVVAVARCREATSGRYLFTAGRESPYKVGVFYFGSFSPSAKRLIDATARVYGRQNDWWGGVEDFYGKQPGIRPDTRNWPGSWPYLKPAIGYYNQDSVDTLRKHIHQAADAGLSFFSFYWYWSNKKSDEYYPEALNSFVHEDTNGLLKFNLTLYAPPWEDDMVINSTNAAAVVSKLVEYFANPNYLRLPDGRPVFAMGDHRNIRGLNGKKCEVTDNPCFVRAVDGSAGDGAGKYALSPGRHEYICSVGQRRKACKSMHV